MTKINKKSILSAIVISFFAVGVLPVATLAAHPEWDATGNYVIDFEYQGNSHPHDMSLAQDGAGNLTGNGGHPVGANSYTWVITSGSVSGNSIDFFADYTATADAVTPQTTMHVEGTIAPDGSMSGTWSDNYQGGDRSGTWANLSGNANALGTLLAEDFGVVDYDTGLGILKGYTAGFGLTDMTFEGATSVVVKLYSGNSESDLLQTNTAILSKFNEDITGTQFSSPFDVSGTFDYETDGYWMNEREDEYGQSVVATRVVATVTLSNGKVVTAENTNLVGDGTTVFPSTMTLTPDTDTNLVGDSHTVTALVTTDGSTPAVGVTVTFEVIAGPHMGQTDTSVTDLNGEATFTYTGTATGTDTIEASATVNSVVVSNTAEKIWEDALTPTVPTDKGQCKNGGWQTFLDIIFRNQGLCIQYVNQN